MDAMHASDAVVAVVRMYTGLLGEKQAEVGGLRAAIEKGEQFFARIGQALETKAKVPLRVGSFEEVTALVETALEQASKNGQILFEQAAQAGKVAAALREALVFAGAGAGPEQAGVLTLAGLVSKAIVDLKTSSEADRGARGRARAHVLAAAIEWATATRSPTAKAAALRAAVQALSQRDMSDSRGRELLRREDAVLAAARAYGAISSDDNGYHGAGIVLRDAATDLATLDLKPA